MSRNLPRRSLAAGALAVVLTTALGACSSGSDDAAPQPETTTPSTSEQPADGTASAGAALTVEAAKAIAVAAVGEGVVTDYTDEDDHGAAWEIEVTRPDGSEVDVYVAADGRVVHVEDPVATAAPGETPAEAAPAPEAPAVETPVEAAPAPEAPAADPAPQAPAASGTISRAEAEQIALAWVGSGRVTWAEREDDRGAAWEIEVTRPNGSEIDVYVSADGRVLN